MLIQQPEIQTFPRALIEEAGLLLEHGHWPRAYFLAVAGIEEIGKALVAYDGQGRNLRDPAVCAMLLRLTSDHASKIRMAFTGFVVADPRKNTEAAIALIIALQNGREPAMYTDIGPDSEILVPALVVGERAARDCARLATDCLSSAAHHMATVPPQSPTVADDQLFSMKSSAARAVAESEDFWLYYLDQRAKGNASYSDAVVRYRTEFLLNAA